MKKKWIGLSFLFIVGCCGQTLVSFAEEIEKEVSITYWNAKIIEQPEYMVAVPADLLFTKKDKRLDTTVSMYDLEGKPYTGTKAATVRVKSKNNFKLTQSEDFLSIGYTLVKSNASGRETGVTNTLNEIGTLNKDQPKIKGYAYLGSTSIAEKNIGIYEDLLTYTIEAK